jgi:hypothetical protein
MVLGVPHLAVRAGTVRAGPVSKHFVSRDARKSRQLTAGKRLRLIVQEYQPTSGNTNSELQITRLNRPIQRHSDGLSPIGSERQSLGPNEHSD